MSITTTHRTYDEYLPQWERIRKVLASDAKQYLRNVGACEGDPEQAQLRQQEYEDGAVLFNFTKRTLAGLVGAVFRMPSIIELPPNLEYLREDANGSGVGLEQQAREATDDALSVSRGGLLADMPPTVGATQADQNAGLLNPTINYYAAEAIRNWRTTRIGSVTVLSLVVLAEAYEYTEDGNPYKTLTGVQYRELYLDDNGLYVQRLHKYTQSGQAASVETYEPRANGKRMDRIPFTFIGSDNNDETIDEPGFKPLVDVQVGHYRNSADNEESLYLSGQAMLVVAPSAQITPSQWAEANPDGVRMGSRQGLNVGQGGTAQLLQAAERSGFTAEMERKEQQAIAIGAQLITPTQQVTAESARLQRGADTSVLGNVARNVSEAYKTAIQWCAMFLGAPDTGIKFELNTEFFLSLMTAQDRAAWVADVNMGYLPVKAYHDALRRSGQLQMGDEELMDELDNG